MSNVSILRSTRLLPLRRHSQPTLRTCLPHVHIECTYIYSAGPSGERVADIDRLAQAAITHHRLSSWSSLQYLGHVAHPAYITLLCTHFPFHSSSLTNRWRPQPLSAVALHFLTPKYRHSMCIHAAVGIQRNTLVPASRNPTRPHAHTIANDARLESR